jgi:hypothetical protein
LTELIPMAPLELLIPDVLLLFDLPLPRLVSL